MLVMKRWVYLSTMATYLLAAANLAAQDSVSLPVRNVELYKNGVGYFEHLGQIKGSQAVEVVLPSSQLNDVLKSLTVLDLGGGQVTGVNYGSTAPLDKRLSELPIDLSSTEGIVGFLRQLRGASVEIRAPGGVVTGRLMGAEVKTKAVEGGTTVQTVQVNIFNSSGEVRQVELESAGALKLTEPSLAGDLDRYYELVNTGHQRDIRSLNIQTSGSGERQLFVSYISEASSDLENNLSHCPGCQAETHFAGMGNCGQHHSDGLAECQPVSGFGGSHQFCTKPFATSL